MKLLILLLLASCSNLYVLDGDTIDLNGERIRLMYIDAPEKNQLFVDSARNELKRLSKNLRIERHGKDKYGRTLAVLYNDTVCINERLVRIGLAWNYGDKYKSLMTHAKNNKIGIWSKKYVEPYKFRNNEKRRQTGMD